MAASPADLLAKGLEALIGGNDTEATVKQVLNCGYPELNYALTNDWLGAAAVGRIMEISGPPSAGKTALSTVIMTEAQRMGGIAGFCDHERSFAFPLAEKIGLDTKAPRFIYKKPETFEASLSYCAIACDYVRSKKLIPDDAPIVWVFDSLAAMVPHALLYDAKGNARDIGKRNMRDQQELAMVTSALLPVLAQHCDRLNICAIILNQIRTKPGVVYGDPRYTPGGNSKEFYFSQRVMLGASAIKDVKTKETIGQQVTATVIKNKVARPFRTATWRFEYMPDGTGRFAYYRSLIDFLVREKCLTMAGSYIVWKGVNKYPGPLAAELEAAGAWDELIALLPAKYEPPVVAVVDEDAPAEAA